MKIPFVGTELFMQTDIRTDRHDATNSSFSKFYERACEREPRNYICKIK